MLKNYSNISKLDDLHNVEGKEFVGYWRMYFNHGYGGRWFNCNGDTSINGRCAKELKDDEIEKLNEIINYITDRWKGGCDYFMIEDLVKKFEAVENNENRYILEYEGSDNHIIVIDTTYRNHDYPIRIYVYREKRM